MFDSAIHTVKLRKSDRSAVLLMNLRFFRHEKNWVYLGLVVRISQNMKRIFWKLSSASKSSLVVTIETPKIRYVLQVYFIRPQTAVHRSKVPIDTRLNVVIQSLLVTPIITRITNIEPNSLILPNSNLLFDFWFNEMSERYLEYLGPRQYATTKTRERSKSCAIEKQRKVIARKKEEIQRNVNRIVSRMLNS